MVLPPRTELMEGELKQRIKEADYDAVLVIRPKAFRKETQEVGTKSVYMPPPFYQNLWPYRSEEHTSELQSHSDLVCRLLLEKKKKTRSNNNKTEPSKIHTLNTTHT